MSINLNIVKNTSSSKYFFEVATCLKFSFKHAFEILLIYNKLNSSEKKSVKNNM